MDALFVFTRTFEDGSEKEVSFTAESWTDAKELVWSDIRGGEGLLSNITLSDGCLTLEYVYSCCDWVLYSHEYDESDWEELEIVPF